MYCLRGEEESIRCLSIVVPVKRLITFAAVWSVGRKLEEEDYAVYGMEVCELGWFERDELLELDIFDAKIVEEVGKDALGVEVSMRRPSPVG